MTIDPYSAPAQDFAPFVDGAPEPDTPVHCWMCYRLTETDGMEGTLCAGDALVFEDSACTDMGMFE